MRLQRLYTHGFRCNELCQWFTMAVFMVFAVGGIVPVQRERKESVFPESEMERLRKRLKLRVNLNPPPFRSGNHSERAWPPCEGDLSVI